MSRWTASGWAACPEGASAAQAGRRSRAECGAGCTGRASPQIPVREAPARNSAGWLVPGPIYGLRGGPGACKSQAVAVCKQKGGSEWDS